MRELRPGLFHWTTFHEGIGAPVSSYYVEPAGALTDGRVPDEGIEAAFDGRAAPQQASRPASSSRSGRSTSATSKTCCPPTASRWSAAGRPRSERSSGTEQPADAFGRHRAAHPEALREGADAQLLEQPADLGR